MCREELLRGAGLNDIEVRTHGIDRNYELKSSLK